MSKFTFKYNGKEYRMVRPTVKDHKEARKFSIKVFNEAIKDGAMLKSTLEKYLESQGIWSEEEERKLTSLSAQLMSLEQELKKGGIKLSQAHAVAMRMRILRRNINSLTNVKSNFHSVTVEGQADDAKFDYLIYCCLVYNDTGKKCFGSYQEYLDNIDQELADLAGTTLMSLMFGLESSITDLLPELHFLKKYNFLDEEGRLKDTQGRLVDADGQLIDEHGNLINEQGQRVNIFGETMDDQKYDEELPFLDDDGHPIICKEDETNNIIEDTNQATSGTA